MITLYAAYVALIACFSLAGREGLGLVALISLIPAGTLLLASFWSLSQIALPYASEGAGVTVTPPDERQLQVRDRAFYRAYQAISALFGLWIVYESIARTNTRQWFWLPQTFDEYQAIVWAYLLVSMTVPSAIIAWTEPDLAEADGDVSEFRLAR